MGKIQVLLHVQHILSPPALEDGRLSAGHDPLRLLGVGWHGCSFRYTTKFFSMREQIPMADVYCGPDYVQQQTFIQNQNSAARVDNDDIVGAASFNIFVGIAVAFIFGSAFFFDLFWPERHENRGVRVAWKICAVAVSLMTLASALVMTV